MKKFITTLCAAAISVSFAGTGLAQTAAGGAQTVAPPTSSDARVIQVQGRDGYGSPRQWNGIDSPRHYRGGGRHFRDGRHYRGRIPHYRGYRGHHRYRPGYRRHGNFWYPGAAFIAGAIISGAINNANRWGSPHIQWCYDRYRSYRASDNTYQPYHGPRQQCYSPYS